MKKILSLILISLFMTQNLFALAPQAGDHELHGQVAKIMDEITRDVPRYVQRNVAVQRAEHLLNQGLVRELRKIETGKKKEKIKVLLKQAIEKRIQEKGPQRNYLEILLSSASLKPIVEVEEQEEEESTSEDYDSADEEYAGSEEDGLIESKEHVYDSGSEPDEKNKSDSGEPGNITSFKIVKAMLLIKDEFKDLIKTMNISDEFIIRIIWLALDKEPSILGNGQKNNLKREVYRIILTLRDVSLEDKLIIEKTVLNLYLKHKEHGIYSKDMIFSAIFLARLMGSASTTVLPMDFKGDVNDPENLWRDLKKQGYFDENGLVLRAWSGGQDLGFNLEEKYKSENISLEVRDIIRIAFDKGTSFIDRIWKAEGDIENWLEDYFLKGDQKSDALFVSLKSIIQGVSFERFLPEDYDIFFDKFYNNRIKWEAVLKKEKNFVTSDSFEDIATRESLNKDEIFKNLIDNGYIDSKGNIQRKFMDFIKVRQNSMELTMEDHNEAMKMGGNLFVSEIYNKREKLDIDTKYFKKLKNANYLHYTVENDIYEAIKRIHSKNLSRIEKLLQWTSDTLILKIVQERKSRIEGEEVEVYDIWGRSEDLPVEKEKSQDNTSLIGNEEKKQLRKAQKDRWKDFQAHPRPSVKATNPTASAA